MERHTKIFLIFFLFFFLVVIVLQFKNYVLKNNFELYAHTNCNPANEECFAPNCSGEADASCEERPYKKIEKLASKAPNCDLSIDSCRNLSCQPGEEGCVITYCSDDALEDGETCLTNENDISSTTENIILNQ